MTETNQYAIHMLEKKLYPFPYSSSVPFQHVTKN